MRHQIFIVGFLAIITSTDSTAQGTSGKSFRYSDPAGSVKEISQSKKNSKARVPNLSASQFNSFLLSHKIQSEVKATTVNIQAVRDFTRRFAYIQNPTWYKTEAGFIVSFKSNEIFTKIAYDQQGRWLYNLLEYIEANMSFEIRNMIKRKYYDYDIQIIHQYEFKDDKTVYMIRMQDRQSNLVTLKVWNEEMELLTPHD